MVTQVKQCAEVSALIKTIDDFLSDKSDPLAFSYDFPNEIIEHSQAIKAFDPQLFGLFNEELPDICYWYEDDADYDPSSEVLDLPHFKTKVSEQKDLILSYMSERGIST